MLQAQAHNMLPIIANKSFVNLCEVDDYISFIWTRRYYDVGDFELVISMASTNRPYMQEGYYIIRPGFSEVGIIEKLAITKDLNEQQTMVVSGRFATSILSRRIIAQQTQVSGTIEACVKQLINQNVISPTNTNRRIPGFGYGQWSIPATSMQQQFTGTNLLDAVQGIFKAYNLGFKTELTEQNTFSFVAYNGVDRSYNQDVNPYVVFSDEYDNLASSDYSEDYSATVTDVLVAGEGEGLERKTVWASATVTSGLNRHEIFVDARNASTNNGQISDAVYTAQLREEGLESLNDVTQAFAGGVYLTNVTLGIDFDVGDVVVIENKGWGIGANARLVEVIESVNEAGVYTVTPTFDIGASTVVYTDETPYINTESNLDIVTERRAALYLERGAHDADASPYKNAVKISELDEITALDDSALFVVATGGDTKKVTYEAIKGASTAANYENLANKPSIEGVVLLGNKTFAALGLESLTNNEIEELLT